MDYIELLSFAGGILTALITVIVKDAVSKSNTRHRIKALEDWRQEVNMYRGAQVEVDKMQDAKAQRNSEDILRLREQHISLNDTFTRFHAEYREDVRETRTITTELNKTLSALNATVKGVASVIERLDNDVKGLRSK